LSENVGVGKIVGFCAAFVSEPEDVEAGFITIDATNSGSLAVKMGKNQPGPFTVPSTLR
jgi:hypothetical protein